MTQRQIEMHLREKGIVAPLTVGKTLTVSGHKIRLNVEYGKNVKRSYSIAFAHEEWLAANHKVVECFKKLGLKT